MLYFLKNICVLLTLIQFSGLLVLLSKVSFCQIIKIPKNTVECIKYFCIRNYVLKMKSFQSRVRNKSKGITPEKILKSRL
jgi:hypothetical protein